MKTLTILVSLIFSLISGTVSASSSTQHKSVKASAKNSFKSKTNAQPSRSGLSTDVRFGDQSVGGKYQIPMEALSVVENEKSIDDLIGVRKNFQDRVERTKGMR